MELQLGEAIEVLERTPGVFRAMLAGLSPRWLNGNEGGDTFSPRDVLGHLIHGEETDWMPRVEIILHEGERRPFTPFDRFGFRGWIVAASLEDLLERFAALRRGNLQKLDALQLGPGELERRGRHPALGTVTLGQLIASWAVHDLGHLGQAARVMARQYRDAVGPWREYLTVLDR